MKTALFALCLGLVCGCGDKVTQPQETTTPPPSNLVGVVSVSPGSATMVVGATITFVMTARGADGPTIWSSSDASIVTVDSAGRAQARAAGKATILGTASNDSRIKGAALVTVVASELGGTVP
jgi:uncharacterized protein YjdB